MGVQGRASSGPSGQIGRIIQHYQQHLGASDGFDMSLTSSSIGAGDQQQTYESDEIRQVYHQQQQHRADCLHKQQQQHLAVSSDTEIPSIPSNGSESSRQAPSTSHTDEQVDRVGPLAFANNQSPKQMRTKPLLASQQQQQHQQKHRQLQAHIHEQLQRIYGDRSQQQPQQSDRPAKLRHHQLMRLNRHRQQQQQQQHQLNSQDDQFSSHESALYSMRPFNNNNQHSSSEQTYDSLSSPNFAPTSQQQQQQQQLKTTKQQQHQHQHQRHYRDCRRAVSAIPEEDRDELLLSSPQLTEDDNDDDDELGDDLNCRRMVEPPVREKIANRKNQTDFVRENQLESLHYATATAAALLSATANAAAAIAATSDQQFKQQQRQLATDWHNSKRPTSRIELIRELEPDNNKQHPYQEVGPATKSGMARDCCRPEQQERQNQIRKMKCIHQQQQQIMMMKQQQRKLYSNLAPPTGAYQAVPSAVKRHTDPNHQLQQLQQLNHQRIQRHQQQQAMHGAKQLHHYHRALMNRPIPPPQPPARGPKMMMMMNPGGATGLRQEPAPRYVTQPVLPTALAVVHTGSPSKAASAKADLIGRMLVNNMVAAQRAAAAAASESHYNLKGQPPRLAAPACDPYQQMLAPVREKRYAAHPHQQHQSSAQVLASSGRLLVGRAPSDSSGHSAAPLVVNRDLAPMGCLERLCRIDLTLFWWSLLLISLLFVGIIVTISHYVL